MKIAAVGDNCIDLYTNRNQAYPGGNPVNVAVFFVRLGGKASYTGVVGRDEYGKMMIKALKDKKIDISNIKILPGKTAVTHVELIDGERVFGEYHEGVMGKFRLTEEDITFLAKHDIVVSGLWGKVENELHKIKEKGVSIAFDFATKLSGPVIEESICYVDYAFFAYDGNDYNYLREHMKKMYTKGPKLVIVTLGDKGSLCYDGSYFTEYGVKSCKVIDTMGAGDSYIAGFLYGILRGKNILESMRLGAENAAATLQYFGAWY